MRSLVLFLGLFFINLITFAQTDENPAVWSHEVHKLSDTEFELVFKGKIMDGWHVYSQYTAEGGSLPSEFTFEKAGVDYELIGETEESETIKEYSDIFEVEETFFKKEAIFTQKIKLLNPEVNQISVNLFYQICKEVCLPVDEFFQISLDGSGFVAEETSLDERSVALGESLKVDLKNKTLLNQSGVTDSEGKSNLWVIFGLGFIGGLIALLTPCVFPMIPLTVSFFTKQSQNKSKGIANALLYGFFMLFRFLLTFRS